MWTPEATDPERESMHPLLMNMTDVAEMLKEHPMTVANRARRGELPGTQIGVQWRFWRPTILRAAVGDVAAAQVSHEQVDDPGVVTPKELADLIGISVPAIMTLLQAGEIPAGQLGKRWHIYWPAIRDAIADGRPLNSAGPQ